MNAIYEVIGILANRLNLRPENLIDPIQECYPHKSKSENIQTSYMTLILKLSFSIPKIRSLIIKLTLSKLV